MGAGRLYSKLTMADANITPDETPKLPPQAGQELGQSGTYLFSGFISGEEYNLDLTGKTGLQQYDIMRKSDATVHATLIVVKNPIIGASWDIEPASDDPIDMEIADYIKRELFGRNIMWQDTIREALTALDFGHAVFEEVFDLTEFNGKARIGFAGLKSRKQRSIMRWETSGGKPGITQIVPTGQMVDIPRNKLLYVVNEREGENYEGISLLRFAYKPWKIKDALELMNAIALERMAVGIPVVTKNVNNVTTDEGELQTLRTGLRDMRANEEAYLEPPAGATIEMLDMKSNTTKDVLPTIQYQNQQITMSVLAQFLMLGQTGGSGSRAVSADHSTLFVKSLEAVARVIQTAFQKDVINRLVDLNYSNIKNGYPRLVFSDLSDDDADTAANGIASLITAGGLTPDPEMENRIRKMFNLPPLTEEMVEKYDELRKPTSPIVDPTQPAGNKDANTPTDNKQEVDEAGKDTPTKASLLADARKAQMNLIEAMLEA